MTLLASSIHDVSTRELKLARVNVKTKPSLRLEFRAYSILEDDTMSDLINHYMKQCVSQAKIADPLKFEKALEIARQEEQEEIEKRKRRANAKYLNAEETKHRANSGLIVLPPPPPVSMEEIAEYISKKTGARVDTKSVLLYRVYVKGEGDMFLSLPEEIKQYIIAYYEGRLDEYLSEERTG
jgi:hypothetical protein